MHEPSAQAGARGLIARAAQSRQQNWARGLGRRKLLWMLLLAVGFWFARPYYLPWTAAEENGTAAAVAAQGSVLRQIGMPCLGLLACYMLWRTPNAPKFKGRLAAAAAAYCALMAVSIAWSVDPATTLKRLVVFFLCVLLLIAMAKCFTVLDLAKIGFYVGVAIAIISLSTEIFVTHSFAPFDPDYRLMGVMSSNSQGQNLTACVFCGIALMIKNPRRANWIGGAAGAAGILLYLTRSRTSTIACLLLSLFFIKRIIDAKYPREIRMVVALVLLAAVVPPLIILGSRSGKVLQDTFMMGRADTQSTASLSNRAPLWSELAEYAGRRPLLGYGYNAFWTPDRIALISAHQGWGVPNAHSTYLDQQLSGGIVSTVLFCVIFWGCTLRAWMRYRRNPCAETLLPPILLSWLVFTSMVETVPIDPFLPTFLAYTCLAQTLMAEGAAFERPAQSAAEEALELAA